MLDKNALKAALKQSMVDNLTNATQEQLDQLDALAGKWADAFDAFVKSAQINYVSGLANSSGPVTGTFLGNLS